MEESEEQVSKREDKVPTAFEKTKSREDQWALAGQKIKEKDKDLNGE
ncbi:MAG: hypothetical protein ACYCQJ_08760 [Nitrososphaerales archaeon]